MGMLITFQSNVFKHQIPNITKVRNQAIYSFSFKEIGIATHPLNQQQTAKT